MQMAVSKQEPGHDGAPPVQVEARDLYGEGKRERVKGEKNINTDRVEWMYEHGDIDERQHQAALKLQRDWELSLINPVASSVLVGATKGQHELPNDVKVAAMKRHRSAQLALGYDWPIIVCVVERNKPVDWVASALRIDKRKVAGRLWSALHRLADHYGLPGDRQDDVLERLLRTAA